MPSPASWINSEFTGGDNPTGGLFWQWFDKRDDDEPVKFYQGSALTVEGASPEMMLALKTLANRDQDIADAHLLMRMTGIRTPLEIGRNLARFTGPRIFRVQGTDGVYPRVNPEFPHLFDNAPADLRAPADDSDRAETRLASHAAPTQRASGQRCGMVTVTYSGDGEVVRTGTCTRRRGHWLPHRFDNPA